MNVHPFLDFVDPVAEMIPPFSAGTWSYDKMYDKTSSGTLFPLETREKQIREYFDKFEPGKSLVFFYLNYDNPLNSEDKKYVLVGISRLKDIQDYKHFSGMNKVQLERYGSLVWSRFIVHNFPEEGVKIPYQEYLDQGKDISHILFEISGDFTRQFKYVSRELSDDIATELIERMIRIVKHLKKDNIVKEDWDAKLEWLNKVLGEVWKNRGVYPGLGGILEYLGFDNGTIFIKELLVKIDHKQNLLNEILEIIQGKKNAGKTYERQLSQARKKWAVLSDEKRNLLKTLAKFELNAEQVEKIVSEKKEKTNIASSLKQIRENPYLLCEEYVGEDEDDVIGFYRIDNGFFPDRSLGVTYEIRPNDIRRLRALIIEKLRQEKNNGNCFLDAEEIFEYVESKRIDWRACSIDIDTLNADKLFFDEKLTIVVRSNRHYAYLKSVYEDERLIENRIQKLLQRPRMPSPSITWKEKISRKHEHIPEPVYKRVLDEQSKSLENSYRRAFSIITGAAGTGKTQVVDALIRGIKETDGRQTFLILAPTGKAATRLAQRTWMPARTIHRVLIENGWLNKWNYKFKLDGKPLIEQNIIVDEASMLDLELMAHLFKAVDWNHVKRFILVGDPHQLPPIGFGRPFLDIINFLRVQADCNDAVAHLTVNCRQIEESSTALELSFLFLGRHPPMNYEDLLNRIANASSNKGIIGNDLEVHYWKDENDLNDLIMGKLDELLRNEFKTSGEVGYAEFNKLLGIPNSIDERNLDYLQILTPYRGYYFGTQAMNNLVQKKFRSGLLARKEIRGFTVFDKVIQVVNTTIYRKGGETLSVFNGQLGYVKTIWGHGDGAYVRFLDASDDIPYTSSSRNPILENLELGYAITIHKAQGSDFDVVFLVLPKENQSLLSRELVYTALTRSKRKVVLLLQEDIDPLLKAINPANSAISGRNTSIFIFRFTSAKYRESDLIHITANGEQVRSKSEVIIANEMKSHGVSYGYEISLHSKDGSSFKIPDFTVYYEGEEFYWEHLGLTDDAEYMAKWEEKKKWYERNGFIDRLIVSVEDTSGLNSRKIVELIESKFR